MIKYNGDKVKLVGWVIKGANDVVNNKKVQRDWVQAEYLDGKHELSRFPVPVDELDGSSVKDALKKLPKMVHE